MMPADTTPEAWEVFLQIQRRMTPEEKVRQALEMSALVRGLMEAGLREKYPQAGDREIFLRRVRLELGPELFHKAYGDAIPDDGADRGGT
jgi:hypothetical protein